MAKNKFAQVNKANSLKIQSALSEVRSASSDMAVKRRLRTAEEQLSIAPPVLSSDATYIDEEVLQLLAQFLKVEQDGVLTGRYLDRIETLLARRRTLI